MSFFYASFEQFNGLSIPCKSNKIPIEHGHGLDVGVDVDTLCEKVKCDYHDLWQTAKNITQKESSFTLNQEYYELWPRSTSMSSMSSFYPFDFDFQSIWTGFFWDFLIKSCNSLFLQAFLFALNKSQASVKLYQWLKIDYNQVNVYGAYYYIDAYMA